MAPARWRRLLQRTLAALGMACLAVAQAPSALAVLIDSGDGSGNTSAPPDDPGWDWVGRRGGFTAVYLGDGWVLTANHVPVGPVVIDGTSYSMIGSTAVRLDNGDGTLADLKVVGLAGGPPLRLLPIRAAPPGSGTSVVMIGNGRDRGVVTSACDPNGPPPPGPAGGYTWDVLKTIRWGTNEVEGFLDFDDPGNPARTETFVTIFDEFGTSDEAQAVEGDSGGAVFVDNGVDWELAGLLYAGGWTGSCPPPPETSIYGISASFAADLSFYRDQIEDIVALPEPDASLGLGCGAALLAWLARRRGRLHDVRR